MFLLNRYKYTVFPNTQPQLGDDTSRNNQSGGRDSCGRNELRFLITITITVTITIPITITISIKIIHTIEMTITIRMTLQRGQHCIWIRTRPVTWC